MNPKTVHAACACAAEIHKILKLNLEMKRENTDLRKRRELSEAGAAFERDRIYTIVEEAGLMTPELRGILNPEESP